jgi:hypothetical protein
MRRLPGLLHLGVLCPDTPARCGGAGADSCGAAGQCGSRPQTCRDYDCRVFAAAGVEPGGPEKLVINRRVRQWLFSYPTELDRNSHQAVRATAAFIRAKRSSFPGQRAPVGPSGVSVLACESYSVFLQPDIFEKADTEVAQMILSASREFHQRHST